MYNLSEVWVKNFRSYKEYHLKDIDSYGLTLINGKNGAGKSTLRLAIEYLLTDSMSEDINVNEFTFNKEGDCELGCIIKKGSDVIKIVKYRQHKKFLNSTILEINGDSESYTQTNRKDTQKEIDKYFNITKESLSISTIFSGESLSFPKCKESDRKKILYDALGLHKYTFKQDKAKEKSKELIRKVEDLELEIKFTKSNIVDSKNKLDVFEEKSKEWEHKRTLRVSELKNEIKLIKATDNSDQIVLHKEEVKKLHTKISGMLLETKELSLAIVPQEWSVQGETNEKYQALKKDNMKIEFEISRKKKEKDMGSTCPYINDWCATLESQSKDIKEKREKELKELNELSCSQSNTLYEMDLELKSFDTVTNVNEDTNRKIKELGYFVDQIKRQIQHTEDKITDILNYQIEKKERISKIESAIQLVATEDDPYIEMAIEEEQYALTKEKDIKVKEIQYEEYIELVRYYKFLITAYGKSGIPNMKMEGFLESLEIETNKILSDISDKLYVTIDSQGLTQSGEVREKIDYKVNHPYKKIANFWSYSGGQRQRINLASMFAFNSLLSKFNFIILDEVLELSLDIEGKTDIIQLLKNKVQDVGTILCVSHDDSIKDAFNSHINIKMTNDVSEIKEV